MGERDSRYNSKGRVYIAEVPNTEALLKNLSTSGLCVESGEFIEVLPSGRYSMDIVPEKDSKLNQFQVEVETRWVKAKMKSSESGFVIVVPPGTEGRALLEQYLTYLASKPEGGEEAGPEAENQAEARDK